MSQEYLGWQRPRFTEGGIDILASSVDSVCFRLVVVGGIHEFKRKDIVAFHINSELKIETHIHIEYREKVSYGILWFPLSSLESWQFAPYPVDISLFRLPPQTPGYFHIVPPFPKYA